MSSYLYETIDQLLKMLPCGVCNPILYIMGQNDPFPNQQLFSLEQYHCGETVTIIAVTIIQYGGRRRRWVRAGPDLAWRQTPEMGPVAVLQRARPDCDAYTQQCALFSAHTTRASTVLVLRAMLCKSVHLFLKYGPVKLSWYDCNFRLSCHDTDPILIRNFPLSRKKCRCLTISWIMFAIKWALCVHSISTFRSKGMRRENEWSLLWSRRTLRYWFTQAGHNGVCEINTQCTITIRNPWAHFY